jgi:hypothetical protein
MQTMGRPTLETFAAELFEQIAQSREANPLVQGNDDLFTMIMLEYLEEAGEVVEPLLCPFRSYGLQLNAYSVSEDYEKVDIFVSLFNESPEPQSISRTEIETAVRRGLQFFRKAINDLYQSFEKDSDTYGFAIMLHENRNTIRHVRVTALTNGLVKPIPWDNITLDGIEVSFAIWDIDRLYRCVNSGKMREAIVINFLDEYGTTIECIESRSGEAYTAYLAILPGELLAKIYGQHGARLLERNVRSFLQVKGQVNKGIRDTLRDEPEMFLAYNNGISATAESVLLQRDSNGRPSITQIADLQIVNGGQTTASIYNALRDKKNPLNLSLVNVQMKLTVIGNLADMDQMVRSISTFANTQNKIQMADFSANDKFHRRIEDLSRVIWAPAQNGLKPKNWFYERARGQYADMLSKESTSLRRKQFKEEHPLFSKTDLAKYENTWDQLPYFVSEGAQKNFNRFMTRLNDHAGFTPDTQYYQLLIGKAILFRTAEKLIQAQNYGGYRANIVTYTLALISHVTSQRIDLDRIWREQRLSLALESEIVRASELVQRHITTPPGNANIGEWCKSRKCWELLLERPYCMSSPLEQELIQTAYAPEQKASTTVNGFVSEEDRVHTEMAASVEAQTWYALSHWAKETNNFQTWERSLIFSMGSLVSRGKSPSVKQARQGLRLLKEAKEKGFD